MEREKSGSQSQELYESCYPQTLGTDGVRAGQGWPGVFSHHSQEDGGTIPGGRGRFGAQEMGRIRTLRV